MASKTASRLWHVCKEAGRPWPQLDDDDVIDFMVMEAVAITAAKEAKKQEENQERQSWKKDKGGLDKLREVANR